MHRIQARLTAMTLAVPGGACTTKAADPHMAQCCFTHRCCTTQRQPHLQGQTVTVTICTHITIAAGNAQKHHAIAVVCATQPATTRLVHSQCPEQHIRCSPWHTNTTQPQRPCLSMQLACPWGSHVQRSTAKVASRPEGDCQGPGMGVVHRQLHGGPGSSSSAAATAPLDSKARSCMPSTCCCSQGPWCHTQQHSNPLPRCKPCMAASVHALPRHSQSLYMTQHSHGIPPLCAQAALTERSNPSSHADALHASTSLLSAGSSCAQRVHTSLSPLAE